MQKPSEHDISTSLGSMTLGSPLTEDVPAFLTALGLIVGLIAVCELLKKLLHIPAKVTRKIVHIGTAIFVFFSPYFFQSNFFPALIPAAFIPFNLLAVRFGWLQSLHGEERASASDLSRNYGTVYFPIAFLLLTLLCWGKNVWMMQTAMLVLGLGDSAAAIVGENIKNPHQYKFATVKSLEGSLTMFIVSFATIYLCLLFFMPNVPKLQVLDSGSVLGFAIALALIATATESLLSGGADNLFVPLAVAYPLAIIEIQGPEIVPNIILGVAISGFVARASLSLKFLTASGSTATFLLASNIFSMGGWVWTVPIMTFFVLSSILSKIGKAQKKKYDLIFEKGSQRDMAQVFANGGVGWLLMIWYSFVTDEALREVIYIGYLGTIAAVQADTWATEIGTMVRNPKPVSILTFKPVPAGTSGGITFLGTMGGLLGAIVICASAWLSNFEKMEKLGIIYSFALVGGSGLFASLVDSLLGATMQAQYYDPIRQKITERTHSRREDGTIIENELQRGYRWMDNDLVNFICGITGAGLAILFK
ncbi:MAG: DUF92 domain-containing protein [Chloroherpetonaceae bacterium]|nr:DUF92 domain-containing protein [Chloroherpetonaceae bacterium]